ncbi:hypothetical protein Hanom_Chr14g01271671 [Helianthus anomalus]
MPIPNSGGNPINMRKLPCGNRTQDLLVPKSYPTPKMPLGYKAMGRKSKYNNIKIVYPFILKSNKSYPNNMHLLHLLVHLFHRSIDTSSVAACSRQKNISQPSPKPLVAVTIFQKRLASVPNIHKRLGNVPMAFPSPKRPQDGYSMLPDVPVLHRLLSILQFEGRPLEGTK